MNRVKDGINIFLDSYLESVEGVTLKLEEMMLGMEWKF